jgi:hypothetical protein
MEVEMTTFDRPNWQGWEEWEPMKKAHVSRVRSTTVYEAGWDEGHVVVFLEFISLLQDIPFVIIGLCLLAGPPAITWAAYPRVHETLVEQGVASEFAWILVLVMGLSLLVVNAIFLMPLFFFFRCSLYHSLSWYLPLS